MFNIDKWLDFLGNLSGYKQKYKRCSVDYIQCQKRAASLNEELAEADKKIKQLKLLLPRPE